MLQNKADSNRLPAVHTYLDINNSLDDGISVDYSSFDKIFNSDPRIQNIVQRYDGNGIVLKTKAKPQDQVTVNKKSSTLDSMAKRAASKEIKS